VLGGQSILFAKSFSELVKAAYHGDDGFHHAPTYFIVVALIVCQILQVCPFFSWPTEPFVSPTAYAMYTLQIHFLNGALTHYDALSVVPLFQAHWIMSGVLGGCIYFEEIADFSVLQVRQLFAFPCVYVCLSNPYWQIVMFSSGCTIIIIGIAILSKPTKAGATPQPASGGEMEEIKAEEPERSLRPNVEIGSDGQEVDLNAAYASFLGVAPNIGFASLLTEAFNMDITELLGNPSNPMFSDVGVELGGNPQSAEEVSNPLAGSPLVLQRKGSNTKSADELDLEPHFPAESSV
jgi:hypothetical protein